MPLAEYRKKRHFDKTAEPAGKVAKTKPRATTSYVIQKHAATRLHYDFRLELDGVLKSWAVPKGPSFDPTDKRLAVEVEDHPIEYAKFEGRIPEGEYGAGEVIVWDRGKWTPIGDPHEGLRKGNLKFELDGEKLHGEWVLVRLHGRDQGGKPNWLLIKHRDEFARPAAEFDVTVEEPTSVKTGRTLEELGETKKLKTWSSNRTEKKTRSVKSARSAAERGKDTVSPKSNGKPRARKKRATGSVGGRRSRAERGNEKPGAPAGATKRQLPESIDVELAVLASEVPNGSQWLHEIKFDGYRLICKVNQGKTTLITRRHQDWTHRYRPIAAAAAKLPIDSVVLDGELVALLPSGVSSFQALQNAGKPGTDAKLVYFVFDLLYLDGYDYRPLPLEKRKQRLRKLLDELKSDELQYSDHIDENGAAFLRESCRAGLEGIISKRRDRPYLSGRTGDWVKVKCLGREELVIGGYTLSTADRRGIGALLVGYFEGDQLTYAGRVGTGFNAKSLVDMRQRLDKLKQQECPFADVPSKERAPSVKWVRPELVAEIQFGSWTDAGILRQPSFQGLREDKAAGDVGRPASLALAMGEQAMPRTKRRTVSAKSANGSAKSTKSAKKSQTLDDADHQQQIPINLTHPERVLYPEMGLTKLGLANYYLEIADWILPHIMDRPLSLVRCPDGQAAGKCFYQKHAGIGTPKVLGRVPIEESSGVGEYVYVRDVGGLLSLVQMSVLEIHPWGSLRDKVENPDRLTMDFDPGPGVSWQQIVDAAFLAREVLEEHDLESFVKTTGGKGLHVVVPISPRRNTWDDAKRFCRHIAEELVGRQPKLYTITMAKAARNGKIFVDYLRNDRGATAVAAYSTRARPGAPVSTPLAWDELNTAIRSDHFNVANMPARLKSLKRDPWAKIGGVKQGIPAVG